MNHLLFVILWLLNICQAFKFYDGLINSRVQSATYLNNAVTKILITLEVKNYGALDTDKYLISLPLALDDKLALIEIYDADKNRLQIERESASNIDFSASSTTKISSDILSNSVFYLVELPNRLMSDGGETSQQLKITIGYIHCLDALPKQIKKTSKQFVVYEASKYFYSPYFTEKLGTKYIFPSDKLKSFTKPAAEIDGKRISYGPFKDIEPFDDEENVRFHFQFNIPYLTMTQVVRDIEISHWGNVRIEESYLLKHDGAKLKGAYEVGMYDRYGHIMGSMATSSDPSSVDSFRALLPNGASNVYYIDRIGNVSTSNFRPGKTNKKSVLEIRPRYPLYGGWKTDFMIGYDVPSAELISIDVISRVHTLNVSFSIPFRDPVTDLLITRIALPEGAHDVKVICPYDIELALESKRYTYLDTMIGGGRPLITFQKANVINLHNQYFQITYVYDTTRIYYKPTLIICGLFTFFASVMIFSRISPSLEESNASKPFTLDLIEKIQKLKNDDKLVSKLEKIAKKWKANVNNAYDDDVRKRIETAIQQIKEINKQHSKRKDNVDAKANISNILRLLQSNL